MAENDNRVISVYSTETERLCCMKCSRMLHTKDVAMLIRTNPTDAFHAWCPKCTWEIVHAAAQQLLEEPAFDVTALF